MVNRLVTSLTYRLIRPFSFVVLAALAQGLGYYRYCCRHLKVHQLHCQCLRLVVALLLRSCQIASSFLAGHCLHSLLAALWLVAYTSLPDCHLVSRSYSLPAALMGGAGHYLSLLLARRMTTALNFCRLRQNS